MLYFGLGMGALLVLIGLATYYLAPRVGPNPIFGVRIGYAYASRETWDKSNRFGGALMALVGVVTASLGLLLTLLNAAPRDGMVWLTGAMLAALFGALAWMFIYSRGLAQGTAMAREITPVRFRWAYLAPVVVTFALLVAVTAYLYPTLPADRIASHFNINEQPDGWMSRNDFFVSFLGFGLLFVVMDALAVVVATREPLIAFGRWGANWRLDPERGLIYTGVALALANLIMVGVLLNVAWFNTRGTFLFSFFSLLWMIVPLIAILIALFFFLGKREA
jgi:uncharacterized membrane protein